jgi:hypothetical protein
VAQHTTAQPGATRIPMMDGAALDARTRPLDREPAAIWLRHRLQPSPTRKPGSDRSRARGWIDRLAGRSIS